MTRGSPPNPAAAPSPPSRRLRRRLLFYPPALALGGLTLLGTDPRLKALSFVAFCIFMALPLGLDALSARPNGRMPGWLAQWEEMLTDPEQKIARPRQLYIGEAQRDYVPIEQRD